ncbi:MAG: hypothetical protein ACLP1X_11985 [Polyangiaceae bacterium]
MALGLASGSAGAADSVVSTLTDAAAGSGSGVGAGAGGSGAASAVALADADAAGLAPFFGFLPGGVFVGVVVEVGAAV